MDAGRVFHINPQLVERRLGESSLTYTNLKGDDVCFADVPVIPRLWNHIMSVGSLPPLERLVAFIMPVCRPGCRYDGRGQRRAEKLVLDFCRDVHTYGLLTQEPKFLVITYQKGLDLQFNVDFTARFDGCADEIGIQASMMTRANWKSRKWPDAKRRRRNRRTSDQEWNGPVYWLTNERIPYNKSIGGTWLFGPQHVRSLVDQIGRDFPAEEQLGLEL